MPFNFKDQAFEASQGRRNKKKGFFSFMNNGYLNKLYIAMVGLPARGKSTVAAKLKEGLKKENIKVRIFNNGDLRRKLLSEDSSRPDFYNPENKANAEQREHIALTNINNASRYLQGDGQVAVLDATNVSLKRRRTIQNILTDHPILFVECINNDEEILKASITKKTEQPEFSRMDFQEAFDGFKKRIRYYEHIAQPLQEERNYYVLDSLNNQILGERMNDNIFCNVQVRDLLVSDWVKNLFLVRHGESYFNLENRIGGDSELTPNGWYQAQALAAHFKQTNIPNIYTSTKKRTVQTARPISEMQKNAQVMQLKEFNEINAGNCEYMSYDEIRREKPEVFYSRTKDKYNYIYPEGEGYVTLKHRVDRGLKKAIYLSGNASYIMIIGHQAVNRMILAHFLYRRKEDVPYIYTPQDRYFHIVSTQSKKLFELKRY